MKKWTKVGIAVGASAATLTTMHLINAIITKASTSKNITSKKNEKTYEWKLGKVSYTVQGKGSPILLVHNLNAFSSAYEWKRVVGSLSKNHTVYSIDLLGCGKSEKPIMTYTAYMYTQMINDFILNVVNKKVDVIASNDASTIVLMSALNNPLAFDNIILVNPETPSSAIKGPDKHCIIRRRILEIPIIGTLVYNICVRRIQVMKDFSNKYIYNNKAIYKEWVDAFHENAHLDGVSAKYLFISKECRYTSATINRAVQTLGKITIINGKQNSLSNNINNEFKALNPTIDVIEIPNSKLLPHLEQPFEFNKTITSIIK